MVIKFDVKDLKIYQDKLDMDIKRFLSMKKMNDLAEKAVDRFRNSLTNIRIDAKSLFLKDKRPKRDYIWLLLGIGGIGVTIGLSYAFYISLLR